ncbi:MAG: galactokinase [Saprospiraceae bacterium]
MENISEIYKAIFGIMPELTASAPGRINLIGEHVDYNSGYVLPAAIDRHLFFAFGNVSSPSINIHAKNLEESVEITFFEKRDNSKWANYFIGILKQLKIKGHNISGFNLVFGGNIPIGGGLSSSSALECGFLKILNQAYNLELSHMEMIDISRASNHNFIGLHGGIMDQFSILNGKDGHAMLLNCETNIAKQISINLPRHDIILIDSKVPHILVDSAYNDRVNECNKALNIIQQKYEKVKHLSMATKEQLAIVEKSMSEVLFKRAKFVIEENLRVHQFCSAMASGNIGRIGKLLYASHAGLKNDYEVSCREIDILINLANKSSRVIGARMIGGGFGGCTLNIIKSQNALSEALKISSAYKAITGIKSLVYVINIVDGVRAIET